MDLTSSANGENSSSISATRIVESDLACNSSPTEFIWDREGYISAVANQVFQKCRSPYSRTRPREFPIAKYSLFCENAAVVTLPSGELEVGQLWKTDNDDRCSYVWVNEILQQGREYIQV